MIRGTFRAQRGQASVLIEMFKVINQALTAHDGFSHGKIYADMTGPMDTIIWEVEAESLDKFYEIERNMFIDADEDRLRLSLT